MTPGIGLSKKGGAKTWERLRSRVGKLDAEVSIEAAGDMEYGVGWPVWKGVQLNNCC